MSLRPHYLLAARAARLGLPYGDVGHFVREIADDPDHPGRRGPQWFLKRNGERIPLGPDLVTAEKTLETIGARPHGKTRRKH